MKMPIFKKIFSVFFLWVVFLIYPGSVYALKSYEIDRPSYDSILKNLTQDFHALSTDELKTIEENVRPNEEDIKYLTEITDSLAKRCTDISTLDGVNRINQNISKSTQKLKQVEKLSATSTEFESDVSAYLRRCYEENNYQRELANIDSIITSGISPVDSEVILSGENRCDADLTRKLRNDLTSVEKSYNFAQTNLMQAVQQFNTKSTRYDELSQNITLLGEENKKLGKKSEELIQDINFLNSKLVSEQQELNLLKRDLSKDYETLTREQTYSISEITQLFSQAPQGLALSLDKKNTWYAFDNQSDLFSFLKLLKTSDAQVSLIQGKALQLIEKQQLITKTMAEKISTSLVLNTTSNQIVSNNAQINEYSLEQNQIKPKLDLYRSYAEERRETDKTIRTDIARLTSTFEKCASYALADFKTVSSQLEALPQDIKTEFEKQFLERTSQKELNIAKNPDSVLKTEPDVILTITEIYKEMLPFFVNCKNDTTLSVKSGEEIVEKVVMKGVNRFNVSIEPTHSFTNTFNEAHEKYFSERPFVNIDVNYYSNFINQELVNSTSHSASDGTPIVLTPENLWSQELTTVKEIYKVYECKDKIWNGVSSENKLIMEAGQCEYIAAKPINLTYQSSGGTINQLVISEMNKFINDNQLKLQGSCI